MPTADADFERTFSDLAFAALRDKAPSLFDYLVGFQVLDVNEDQTHAVGVFGCKVGDEWVYLPQFFNNGELRGSELMYLKNQDMFVPLQENWVTYILNRKPYVLGEATDVTRQQLASSPPDFTSFSYSPSGWNKSASAAANPVESSGRGEMLGAFWRKGFTAEWAQPYVEKRAALQTRMMTTLPTVLPRANSLLDALVKSASERPQLTLRQVIDECGPGVNKALLDFMLGHEKTGEAVLEFYPPEQLMVRDYGVSALAMHDRIEHEKQAKVYAGNERIPGITVRTHVQGQPLPTAGIDGRDALISMMGTGDPGDPDPAGFGDAAHRLGGNYKAANALDPMARIQQLPRAPKLGQPGDLIKGTGPDQKTKLGLAQLTKTAGIGQVVHDTLDAGKEFLRNPQNQTGMLAGATLGATAGGAVAIGNLIDQRKKKQQGLTKSAAATEKSEPKVDKPKDDTEGLPWEKTDTKNTMPEVEVLMPEDNATPEASKQGFSEAEAERLLKGEVVIRDHRKNTTRVYAAEYNKSITTPNETGVFRMIVKDHKGEGLPSTDVLVIHKPLTIGSGEATCVTAVHLKDKLSANMDPKAIQVLENLTGPSDWLRFYGKLTPADELAEGSAYVLITPDGKGTIPFRIAKKRKNADGTTSLWVRADDEIKNFGGSCCEPTKASYRTASTNPKPHVRHQNPGGYVTFYHFDDDNYKKGRSIGGPCEGPSTSEESWKEGRKIIVANRKGGLVNVGDTLFVPNTARGLKLEWGKGTYNRNYEFPQPGNADDAMAFVLQSNFVQPLKVFGHGAHEYSITDGEKTAAYLTGPRALRTLLLDYNLSEKNARALLEQADLRRGVRVFLEKRAAGEGGMPSWFNPGPDSPAVPENRTASDALSGYPAQGPQTDFQSVDGMRSQQGDRAQYNPDPRLDVNPYQLTQDAAQTGQKEVFDAGVVGSLLKVVDSDAMIDKYLGDMFLGMDRVGRVLFLFYQHNEEFRDRYGDEDMQELEDSLKNVFKGSGDLVLFLKQRTVEDSPETQKTEVDLTPVAG